VSKNSKSTSAVTADPTTLARERQMWNTAQGLAAQPYQAYGGEQVAGFTGDQQAGFDAVRNAAGMGAGAVNAGLGLAGTAGAYNPSMVSAPTLDPAAQANGAGLDAMYAAYARTGPQAGARDAASLDAAAKMGQYQNPYEDQVVQSALADQEIQRQRAIMQGQAQATAGGAFGGSRHGVMDSLTNEAAIRAAGATAGNLRSQGFQFAGQMGAADANRDLQAQQGNQQADVATSSTNAGLGANLFGQRMGAAANVGMFNAGQINSQNQFGAGLDLTAQQANQGAGLTANSQRLAAAGTMGQLGSTQQQMGLAGADALLKSGGMQQGLEQANLDTDYNNWLMRQQDPYAKLQYLQGFKGTPGRTQTDTKQGSALGGLLGAVGTIAGGPLGGVIGKAAGGLFGGGGYNGLSDAAKTMVNNPMLTPTVRG
jgi:hypothetical protein